MNKILRFHEGRADGIDKPRELSEFDENIERLERSDLNFLDVYFIERLGNTGASRVANALLATRSPVTVLNLNGTEIGDKGMIDLSKSFETMSTLRWLDLRWNKIGKRGAQHLARSLVKGNRARDDALQILYLDGNRIGDVGVAYIAEMLLRSNSNLKELNLKRNKISDEGAKVLAMAVRKNTSLEMIDLRCNNIGHKGASCLMEAFEKNSTLVKMLLY